MPEPVSTPAEAPVCQAPEPQVSTPAPAPVAVSRVTARRSSDAEPVASVVSFPSPSSSPVCQPPAMMSVAPPPGQLTPDQAGVCAPEGTTVPAPAPGPVCTPTPGEATVAVAQQEQDGNACGTTSLSMVMTYHEGSTSAANVHTIDSHVRPTGAIDSFSAPSDLRDYARSNGYQANLHNHSSGNDLAAQVDQGTPPVILIDRSDAHDGSELHYIVVNGYRDTPSGREFQVTDPNGFQRYEPESDLTRQWSNLQMHVPVVGNTAIGYDRLMLAVAPTSGAVIRPNCQPSQPASAVSVPSDNSPGVVNRVAEGANRVVRIVNGAEETGRDIVHGAQDVGHDIVQGGRNLVNGAGDVLRDASRYISGPIVEALPWGIGF